jgi:hypothetical protein
MCVCVWMGFDVRVRVRVCVRVCVCVGVGVGGGWLGNERGVRFFFWGVCSFLSFWRRDGRGSAFRFVLRQRAALSPVGKKGFPLQSSKQGRGMCLSLELTSRGQRLSRRLSGSEQTFLDFCCLSSCLYFCLLFLSNTNSLLGYD